jgi:FkbM family methyltransferase
MQSLRTLYRELRVLAKQCARIEPLVRRDLDTALEFHGNDYCGWSIPRDFLRADSVVVDVGLGEDVSFSRSLSDAFKCRVHGFDPTPRAMAYVKSLGWDSLVMHEFGVSGASGQATFYLPNDESHVSGSLIPAEHVGRRSMEVQLLGMRDVLRTIGADHIDLLKVDIEGAEYDLLASAEFRESAPRIGLLCIEFHHRWSNYGPEATLTAVRTLRELGFRCVWRSRSSNEEFTFLNTRRAANR